jgi:hypothetical protein
VDIDLDYMSAKHDTRTGRHATNDNPHCVRCIAAKARERANARTARLAGVYGGIEADLDNL